VSASALVTGWSRRPPAPDPQPQQEEHCPMDKLTVRDFDPARKRVLVRVDFNVPIEDGKVKDDSRIRAALPTIRYLLGHDAIVILMSHLDRPNGKVIESMRLRPVAQRLSELLRWPVPITGDALGLGTRDAVARLKEQPGKDIVVLGSGDLVQTLMARGLVDEFGLIVSPLVLGSGKRLFRDAEGIRRLTLVSSKATPKGNLVLSYRPAS